LAPDLLHVDALEGGYGRKRVIYDATLRANPGEIVAIIGHNGAGKTTLLRTVFGMLDAHGGRVLYEGVDICGDACRRNVTRGISMIPAERFVFADLTVLENLKLGAPADVGRDAWRQRLEQVHALFPILAERAAAPGATLSGGQQRMLSLGMAMMREPRLLLLDEPSLGLAPALVAKLFEAVRRLADEQGQAVILVEQNLPRAFAIADRVYVMRAGRTVLEASAAELRKRESYWELF
jgi:branched-chain amino acid transport system ATP-binding protein